MRTEKIQQELSDPKRFRLSKESFARDRITAIRREIVPELKAKYPEVLSFCMFGSMVKGTARPESDIDGYLFVDTTMASRNGKNETAEILPWFKDKLSERLQLDENQMENIWLLPLNRDTINRNIENLIEQVGRFGNYETAYKNWQAEEPPKGADIDTLLAHQRARPEHPPLPTPSLNLYAMFHLDAGGGIKKYRSYLIDQLADMGARGDRLWSEIIQATERMEYNYQNRTKKKYPRTIAEAKKIYG